MVTKFNSRAWPPSGLSCRRLKEGLKPCIIVYRILATKFATAFGGRASFTNPSRIPQFPLPTMTATGARSPSEFLGLTDSWSSPKVASQEGLVSKRHSDPPGDPKTANAVFGFPG